MDPGFGSRAFNARSKKVTPKPTFRAAVKARRCTQGHTETPVFIRSADGSPIYFAGLYEWWKDPAATEGDEGRWLLSCTILTDPSPETGTGKATLKQLAGLHDRLPLPMDRDTMDTWLNPEKPASTDEAETLVEQVRNQASRTASAWALTEVGTAVRNVRNNGPELIQGLG